jgi:glucose 1-dehydrogenase
MNEALAPTPTPSTAAALPVLRGVLTGQSALVTGANSGIGRGVAIALGKTFVVEGVVNGDDA